MYDELNEMHYNNTIFMTWREQLLIVLSDIDLNDISPEKSTN